MANVTAILVNGHREIQGILDRLEAALARPDLWTVGWTLALLEDRLARHRRMEEEVLFPAAFRTGAGRGEPLNDVAQEHGVETSCVEDAKLLHHLATEDAAFVGPMKESVGALIVLLRDHFWKEENFVFPGVERAFGDEEKEDLAAQMAALEAEDPAAMIV
jgi:hemerythrin-like domain-containing protein